MNASDRKIVSQADEGMATHLAALEELADDMEMRIENIQEYFPDGNPTSEQLEEEVQQLREVIDSIEMAKQEMEVLV